MELKFLIKGILLGFGMAAPVGPVGIYCIRKTLQHGRLSGFFSGIGAAIADTLYGVIAAFGLATAFSFFIEHQFLLRLIGGGVLIYIGTRTLLSPPLTSSRPITHTTLLRDLVAAFFLTLTNPLTILSYVAVFAVFGLAEKEHGWLDAAELIGGIFLGSILWWLLLSEGVTLFRKRTTPKAMLWINRTAGLLILSFGALTWFTLPLTRWK